jgi:uncharacterized membrane-anchored protein YhcB (DUF1043 family)
VGVSGLLIGDFRFLFEQTQAAIQTHFTRAATLVMKMRQRN